VRYTEIPDGKGKCPECGRILYVAYRTGRVTGHGPLQRRCPGSGQFPVCWHAAAGLPGWEDMSDLDRGAALLHARQRDKIGDLAAIVLYPAVYFDHADLARLAPEIASRHAWSVTLGWPQAISVRGSRAVTRLCRLALAADRARPGLPAPPVGTALAIPPAPPRPRGTRPTASLPAGLGRGSTLQPARATMQAR
jgi:hypothetical protein